MVHARHISNVVVWLSHHWQQSMIQNIQSSFSSLSLSLSLTCTLFPAILSFYIGNIHRLNPTMIQQKGNHLVNNNNNFDYVSLMIGPLTLVLVFICCFFVFIFLFHPFFMLAVRSFHLYGNTWWKKMIVTAACLLVNVSFTKCLHCDPFDRIHVMSFITCNLYLLQIFAIA